MFRIDFTNGEAIALHAHFHRVAERRETDDFQLGALVDAHLHQALIHGTAFAINAFHDRALAGLELIQSYHVIDPSSAWGSRPMTSANRRGACKKNEMPDSIITCRADAKNLELFQR